ncbi:hypothetical protein FKW80_24800 [Salmonella enterica]|nr:hypothetical protein [Salmonella enterica]
MKMKYFSLKKRWLLISLVLFCPEILAVAGESPETLNFNYTRSDSLSLDPQMALQARACHSLGDPMEIRIRLKNIKLPDALITLTLRGEDYEKNYTLFSSSPEAAHVRAAVQHSDPGPDFLVPWEIAVKGEAQGYSGFVHNVVTPGQPAKYHYTEPFCFSSLYHEDDTRFAQTLGYPAIFEKPNPVGWDDRSQYWESYCKVHGAAKVSTQDEDHYWPGYYRNIPERVANNIKKGGVTFLIDGLFYHKRSMIVDAVPEKNENKWFPTDSYTHIVDAPVNSNKEQKYNPVSLNLTGKGDISVVRTGDFTLKLNNRNITTLTLTITDKKGKSSVFNWKRGPGNTLVYSGVSPHDVSVSYGGGIDDGNDPYQLSNFYQLKDLSNSYFKGTLVPHSLLAQQYTDYINKVAPLSLPPDTAGNINLVNTDSLVFTLEAGDYSILSGDDMNSLHQLSVSIYGQPLKFSSMKKGGKVAVSAMQVRNACY